MGLLKGNTLSWGGTQFFHLDNISGVPSNSKRTWFYLVPLGFILFQIRCLIAILVQPPYSYNADVRISPCVLQAPLHVFLMLLPYRKPGSYPLHLVGGVLIRVCFAGAVHLQFTLIWGRMVSSFYSSYFLATDWNSKRIYLSLFLSE